MNRALAVAFAFILLVSVIGAVTAEPYDVTDGIHVRSGTIQELDFSSDGAFWGDDGTKFYHTQDDDNFNGNDPIQSYTASDPYNASDITQANEFSITTGGDSNPNPQDITFKPDGTRMYVALDVSANDPITDGPRVIQYNLSTAWNITTASQQEVLFPSDLSFAESDVIQSIEFNNDGSKMYIYHDTDDNVYTYALSDPWNVSTHSLVDTTDVSTYTSGKTIIEFNDDGSKFYITNNTHVNQLNTSTDYNVSGTSDAGAFDVSTNSSSVFGFAWDDTGDYFYILDPTESDLDQYSTSNSVISGYVKDTDGNVVSGATVITNDTATDTTDASGFYQVGVPSGTWEISATGPDSATGSITVTANQEFLTNQNITISELTLDVRTFMEHGSRQSYKVFDGTQDVTDAATVTSGDTSVITVEDSTNELVATSDTSVNQKVTITAEYQGTTATKDVTVANKTLDNIPILPPATWPIAIIGQPGDTTGSSGTWPGAIQLQWLFVCLSVGAIVSWRSVNPFMGMGTVEVLLAFGWAINWISDGMLIASIIFLVYASLSLTDIASGNLGHR